MTNLIDVPDDRDDGPERKIPSWLWFVIAGALIVILVIVMTLNASSDRDDKESATGQALSLAETIENACRAGSIPPQFAASCAQAP